MKNKLAIVLVLLAFMPTDSPAQERAKVPGDSVITALSPPAFELWRYDLGKKSFEKSWSSIPLICDSAFVEQHRSKGFLPFNFISSIDSTPAIADVDGDGENELIALDDYGLIIYGRHPAYFPFKKASVYTDNHLLVEDLDDNGIREIVTLRTLPGMMSEIAVRRLRERSLDTLWEMPQKKGLLFSFALASGDVDNDGQKELILGGTGIYILKNQGKMDWKVTAEIPDLGPVDVVCVADLDADGKNEFCASGAGGKVTVYKMKGGSVITKTNYFPVVWQSEDLTDPMLKPLQEGGREPSAYTQGLAVGDIDGDGKVEILAAAGASGRRPDSEATSHGKIHIYKYIRRNTYGKAWTSDWVLPPYIPSLSVGDMDSDGLNEFVYRGMEVYKHVGPPDQYRRIGSFPSEAKNSVIGRIGPVMEPVEATRIVPLVCDLEARYLKPAQTYTTSLTLRNVWAEAKDVTVEIIPEDSYVSIGNPKNSLGTLKSGAISKTPSFEVRIGKPAPKNEDDEMILSTLWIEITATGGYHQSVPMTFKIDLSKQ